MTRLSGSITNTPGPGDLPARTPDPQTDLPGGCRECDGPHPTSRCPHLRGVTQETHP